MSDNNESSECNDLRSKIDTDIEKLHNEVSSEHIITPSKSDLYPHIYTLPREADLLIEIKTLTQRVESAESCLRIYFDLGKGRNPDAIYKEHLEKYRSKE